MIKISKTAANRPSIKFTRGANQGKDQLDHAKAELVKAYNANKAAYNNGTLKFSFDGSLYGHSKIKDALKKLQAKKCCFCEAFVSHVAHGDIEHFRPKGGYKQKSSDALGRPGYFWLAYDWKNLYFSCQMCNQRHKKNLFPLVDAAKRAKKPSDSLTAEKPAFIDPGKVDPSNHITFVKEVAVPVNGSVLGKKSIKELGLNRPDLLERRLEKLHLLSSLKALIDTGSPSPERTNARNIIASHKKTTGEYSAMIKANF